ncbi:MAG: hypothetical protein A3F12_02795 [Gammaproteobacteria bacterium RIFCSPHIGHO2_12_FULL_38_14]|nr:MAG: hypothetical protein A3F12_02795 [Gammaproteobacteria bacterium RIFCSPHIGHO2_12_FULL_38_14]
MVKKIILLLALLIHIPAYALVRGNDVYPICEHIRDKASPNDFKNKKDVVEVSMNRGFLLGYCMGIVFTSFQAIRGIGYTWSVDDNFARCMENYYGLDNINGTQILDMTMKYLKSHPEFRNIEINIIMASMLHNYYPESVCLKK